MGIGSDTMSIEYRKATLDEAERVCYIVQHTKAEIYPAKKNMITPYIAEVGDASEINKSDDSTDVILFMYYPHTLT